MSRFCAQVVTQFVISWKRRARWTHISSFFFFWTKKTCFFDIKGPIFMSQWNSNFPFNHFSLVCMPHASVTSVTSKVGLWGTFSGQHSEPRLDLLCVCVYSTMSSSKSLWIFSPALRSCCVCTCGQLLCLKLKGRNVFLFLWQNECYVSPSIGCVWQLLYWLMWPLLC